jgi:hypothetical protein
MQDRQRRQRRQEQERERRRGEDRERENEKGGRQGMSKEKTAPGCSPAGTGDTAGTRAAAGRWLDQADAIMTWFEPHRLCEITSKLIHR